MPRTTPKQPLVLPDGTRRLMSAQETADRAGLTVKHVRREIERGALKASRLGGVIRVTPEAFDVWVNGDGS